VLTDTHAHLDFPDFADDLPAILERAEAAGIKRMISIGTSIAASGRAVALAERFSQVWAVIGIHPTSAVEAGEDSVAELRRLARTSKIAAIGETGLDYHWLPGAVARREGRWTEGNAAAFTAEDAAEKECQARVFREQLDLAAELGLNVVIHQRNAWDDTLAIVREYGPRIRCVYHCFGETPERARALFDLGHYVSFTGIITFKNAAAVQASAQAAPADRFMLETDCPYLAPVPFRGKRCEPAYVRQIAECVASLRGQSLPDLAAQTEATAETFFRLS
jgi:TatD DNase family protein